MPLIPVGGLLFVGGAVIVSASIGGINLLRKKSRKAGKVRGKRTKQVKLKKDLDGLKDSLLGQIDANVQDTMVEAEALRRKFAGEVDAMVRTERRFSMRVDLQPGEMEVYWTNKNGSSHTGMAVNCSMNGVFFEADDFDADGIDRITSPKADVDLVVEGSSIIRVGEGRVAIMVAEFENNEDSWMIWIELMSRLGKG
jgi:hypothetical protein